MDNISEKNRSTSTVSAGGSASQTGAGWFWTDERHVHFLNSIEATFIRTMYESDAAGRALPLDRQLPDSFESTLDLGKERPTSHSYSADVGNFSSVVRTQKKQQKRLTSRRHDQVVPQLNNRLDDSSNLVSKRSKNSTTAY